MVFPRNDGSFDEMEHQLENPFLEGRPGITRLELVNLVKEDPPSNDLIRRWLEAHRMLFILFSKHYLRHRNEWAIEKQSEPPLKLAQVLDKVQKATRKIKKS